jgi:hypothetical protein
MVSPGFASAKASGAGLLKDIVIAGQFKAGTGWCEKVMSPAVTFSTLPVVSYV